MVDLQEKTIPEQVAILVSSLSVSFLGYDFLTNPQGFVLALVYDGIVDMAARAAGAVGANLATAWSILTDATVGTLDDVLGDLADGLANLILVELIGGIEGIVVDAANAAGPLGPLVFVAMWGLVTLAVVYGAAGAWRLYKCSRVVLV